MKTIFLLAAATIIAAMPMEVSGSPNGILERVWKNEITPRGDCTEIAQGRYVRDGAEKPFILLRKSTGGDLESTAVHLSFLGAQGDKYLIFSRFLPLINNKVETRQAALLPEIDPDRPRAVLTPLYEELRDTNISALFLTLPLHLAKKYEEEAVHGAELEARVQEGLEALLPHRIYIRVEEEGDLASPVEIQMYRNNTEVISTIYIKNGLVNDKLRPFWISLTSREKTDIIYIDSWGLVMSNHEFFTPTGLGRGDLSIPPVISEILCPSEICQK